MKIFRSVLSVFLCLCVSFLMNGCTSGGGSSSGGGSTPTTPTTPTPSLTISSIAPTAVAAGAAAQSLTVNGTGFTASTTILVGGIPEVTTFVSSTQLTASIPAAQLVNGANLPVVAAIGSTTSDATAVKLEIDNPTPAIASLAPTTLGTGVGTATVTLQGTGFVPSTVIQVNGSARSTTYISATSVSVVLAAADSAAPGSLSLTAVNPAPKGGTSAAAAVAVNNPVPVITLLNPATVASGASTTTAITVTGSNFLPSTIVQVNNSARATTYISATQLSFLLTVADQASPGRLSVSLVNPSPGGGFTPTFTLTVAAPTLTPVITSVSPTSFIAGSPSTIINVYGSNFTSTSVLHWKTATSDTSFITIFGNGFGNYLSATIPASLLTSVGAASISVTNPTAPIPNSNTVTVTVSITNPPAPTLNFINPSNGPINTSATITLNGSNFSAASTVSYNGTVLPATYNYSSQLTVTLPAASVALPGTDSFTVTNPSPGGGTSAAMPYSAYVPILSNNMVYNPVNGLFYASVPGSVGAPLANSVVSIDPATGALGTPIFVGSEPNKMAVTADGKFLWVGLDGSSAVRKVDLTAGTAGLQFSLPNRTGSYSYPSTALALLALPGATDSVIVSISNPPTTSAALSIYDSGVARANSGFTTSNYYTAYALQVDASRSEIYAGSSALSTFTYDSTGLTTKVVNNTITTASSGNDEMQLLPARLYTDFGKVYDPEAGTLLGTIYLTGTTAAQGSTVADATLGKIFVVENSSGYSGSGYNQIQIFKTSDYTTVGTIPISVPSYGPSPSNSSVYPRRLTRWGANGLAFYTQVGLFSLQSNAVNDLSTTTADLGVTLAASGSGTTGTNTTFTATVTNAGPSTATDAVLSAQPPSTGSLVSAVPTTGTCTATACSLGSLASGGTATVTFTVLQTTAGASTLTAQVAASTADAAPSNNTASVTQTVTGSAYNIAPALTAITPAAIQSGATDTVITLIGTGFNSGSSVLLGTTPLTKTFVSATQLTATVPAASLASMGWAAISVSNAAPGGGTSATLPLSVFSVIPLGVNRILYDPFSRKIMASVGSGSSSITGNSIAAITPETATVGTPVSIGSQPSKLALSDDGQVLYTILSGANSIARYNMLTGAADGSFTLAATYGSYSTNARDIAVQPGTENTVAVDLGSSVGAALFDYDPTSKTGAIRGTQTGFYTGSCLQFLNPTDLYSFDIDSSFGLYHEVASSTGLSSVTNYSTGSTLNHFSCFKINGGLAFASAGGIANPAPSPAVQIGTLAGPYPFTYNNSYSGIQALAPDVSLHRAFYPVNTTATSYYSYGNADGIAAYNLDTFLQSAVVPLNMTAIEGSNTSYSQVDLIRWGQDGLAILTSGGHIYLLRGPVVVPQLLNTNAAAVLTASSVTTVTHGAGNTLVTLTGSNFVPGVAVTWNGTYRTTTIVDATHITVAIPSTDLTAAGSGSLIATNPGAPASSSLTVTIN